MGDMKFEHYHGHCLVAFVLVWLAIYLLLTFYNPKWVQQKFHGHHTGVNNQAITMLWALFITLVIFFVLALLWWAFYCA